ncbi:MAG: alpha/beta fold hydrolase [Bacteroidota bacterium]|nr:alpha/beta fold hydrolase [Bacteroidota bacterium]
MKGVVTAVLLLLTFPCHAQITPGDNLEVTGIPDIPQQVVDRTSQYLNVRSAAFSDWDAAGEGMFISTRFGNTAQIHHVAAPGAARRQLTFFEEPVYSASADPREGRDGFCFSRDVGGGEFYQVFYFDRSTGESRMLTDGTSRNSGAYWSHGRGVFSFSSNRRNGTDTDVWIMDPDSPEDAWALTEREGSWYGVAWAPDDSRMVVIRYISANVTHPYIADLESRELTPLFEKDAKVSYANFEWAPDGNTIYYTSDEEDEFQQLYALDVATMEKRNLTPQLRWDIENLSISDDGGTLAYTMNENGISTLHLFRLPEMTPVVFDPIPVGLIGGLGFSDDSRQLALNINAADNPTDVWVMDIAAGTVTRWTYSEVGGLNTASFSSPALVHYPTFDEVDGARRHIPAFVYKPQQRAERLPVIINIHGGPEGQSRPYFSSTTQYWVNELGCAVIFPNVRGSTGYGKTWLALDNGFNREQSVQDIGALLDWIAAQPDLDPSRVAVFGGSYGGYMVLSSMTTYPDRIKCGVDVVGISNFVTFLENTQDYRRDLRRVEYGDERDPAMREFLLKISPTNNADKIRSPLFVAQGENDPRVPASEARQIVQAVSDNGIPVWTMFARDEGHGFRKKNNRDYFTWATILFFENFLIR